MKRELRTYTPIDIALHMRVEDDWKQYSAQKRWTFVDMDQTMRIVVRPDGTGWQGSRGTIFVLTGEKTRLAAYVSNHSAMRRRVRWSTCNSQKGTMFNYMWCAAMEYELALRARLFVGYPRSTFSSAAMQQRLRSDNRSAVFSYVEPPHMNASTRGPLPVTLKRNAGAGVRYGEFMSHVRR
jgi:hypothetical protein